MSTSGDIPAPAGASESEVKLRAHIGRIEELPTLPDVLARIHKVIQNPRASADDVGTLIGQDQALAAKTLKLVNSAFFGFPGRISNITRAIVILGFQRVKNIAMAASVFDAFRGGRTRAIDYHAFWQHSIATAIASEALAKRLHSPDAEDAFIGGLLHDVGKLLLCEYLRDEAEQVVAHIKAHRSLFYEAELELLGFHHGMMGEWLTEKWQFPEKLRACIRRHHRPACTSTEPHLVAIVHAADVLARALMYGSGGDPGIPELLPAVADTLRLGPDLTEAVMRDLVLGMKKAGTFFEMAQ